MSFFFDKGTLFWKLLLLYWILGCTNRIVLCSDQSEVFDASCRRSEKAIESKWDCPARGPNFRVNILEKTEWDCEFNEDDQISLCQDDEDDGPEEIEEQWNESIHKPGGSAASSGERKNSSATNDFDKVKLKLEINDLALDLGIDQGQKAFLVRGDVVVVSAEGEIIHRLKEMHYFDKSISTLTCKNFLKKRHLTLTQCGASPRSPQFILTYRFDCQDLRAEKSTSPSQIIFKLEKIERIRALHECRSKQKIPVSNTDQKNENATLQLEDGTLKFLKTVQGAYMTALEDYNTAFLSYLKAISTHLTALNASSIFPKASKTLEAYQAVNETYKTLQETYYNFQENHTTFQVDCNITQEVYNMTQVIYNTTRVTYNIAQEFFNATQTLYKINQEARKAVQVAPWIAALFIIIIILYIIQK